MVFEHFLHPCVNTSSSFEITISRFLLPFGPQGYEILVSVSVLG